MSNFFDSLAKFCNSVKQSFVNLLTKPKKTGIKRTKRNKILSLVSAGFITTAAIGSGIGAFTWSAIKYTNSSDFDKQYNIRFELDPTGFEDPNRQQATPTLDDAKANVDKAVDAYSAFLNQKGIEVTNIYPEVYEEGSTVKAFINAVVPNIKTTNPNPTDDDKDKLVDEEKTKIYFNDLYGARLSVFYHKDINGISNANKDYIITKEDLVSNDKDISLPESAYETSINIRTKQKFTDIKDYFKDRAPSDEGDVNEQPYMYVINDQQGLINYLRFLLMVGQHKGSSDKCFDIYTYWLDESEKQFIDDYLKADPTHSLLGSLNDSISPITDVFPDNTLSSSTSNTDTLVGGAFFTDNKIPGYTENNGYYNFIEKVNWEDKGYLKHTGELKYNFLSKWIVGIITDDSDGSSSYLKYFPDNDPTKSSKSSNDQWMVLPSMSGSRFDSELLAKEFTKYVLPYPIKSVDFLDDSTFYEITGYDLNGDETTDNPTYINLIETQTKNNIFGSSASASIFVFLIVVMILIGIIVSLLYKIPGIVSFSLMFLTVSATAACLISNGFQLSISMLLGLSALVALSAFNIVNYFERFKKQIAMTYDMNTSTKRTFMSSFMPCADLHILILLIGVVLVYFGNSLLTTAGVVCIIGSLFSFLFSYLVLNATMFVLFANSTMSSFFNLFIYKKQKKLDDFHKQNLVEPNLNKMSFFGNVPGRQQGSKLGFINKVVDKNSVFGWRNILFTSISVLLIIIGLSILFTVGVHSSYSFFGGTRLVVFSKDGFNMDSVWAALSGTKWYSYTISGNYLYMYSNQAYTYDFLVEKLVSISNNVRVASISSAPIMSFVGSDIQILFIAAGFITIYSLLRHGWTGFIGTFIGIVMGPLLTMCIISVCQIYFDTNILYVGVLIFIINALFVFNMMSNVNSLWFKQKITDHKEVKAMINRQIVNCFWYYVIIFGLLFVITLTMLLTLSTTFSSFAYLVLIGSFVSIFVSMMVAPYILSWFVYIKNKYLVNLTQRVLRVKNYDTIDEEMIDGVNRPIKDKTYL